LERAQRSPVTTKGGVLASYRTLFTKYTSINLYCGVNVGWRV